VISALQEKSVAVNDAMKNAQTDEANNFYKPVKRRRKMKWFFTRKIRLTDPLFNGHFVDVKTFYVLHFDKVPCIDFIGEIDITKAFEYIKENLGHELVNAFQHVYFDHDKQQIFFNNSVYVLRGNRMIELTRGYAQILHTPKDYIWADELMTALAAFKVEAPAYQTQVVGFARQPEMN
jgi:hypothetical protein